jgi:hypothetical protein
MTSTTLISLVDRLAAGDVIEVPTATGDDAMTALVLLVTDEFAVLDPCDGSTPFVLRGDEMVGYRRFDDGD